MVRMLLLETGGHYGLQNAGGVWVESREQGRKFQRGMEQDCEPHKLAPGRCSSKSVCNRNKIVSFRGKIEGFFPVKIQGEGRVLIRPSTELTEDSRWVENPLG